jgi:ABC-type transport system involved in multi-copper enzyme maturation permease subunit
LNGVLKLTRWEWFKLQRRRIPWIMLGILLLFTQLAVWGPFIAYNALLDSGGQVFMPVAADGALRGRVGRGGRGIQSIACNALGSDPTAVVPSATSDEVVANLLAQCRRQATRLQEQYAGFTPTASISTALGVASTIGLVLLGILTATTIGSDYGLGTLRPILVRGPGRLAFLSSKLLLLIASAAGMLFVVSIAAAFSGWVAMAIGEPPPGAVVTQDHWIDAFTGALTVLTRSTAAGMAISLGYYFTEGILATLMSALFDWFDAVAEFLLVRNINAFVGGGLRFAPGGNGSEIEPFQASVVLAGYVLVFVGLTVWVFLKRDVTGANSG